MNNLRDYLALRTGLKEESYKNVKISIVPIDYKQCHSDQFETLLRDDSPNEYFLEIRTNVEELMVLAQMIFQKFCVEQKRPQTESAIDMQQSYFS